MHKRVLVSTFRIYGATTTKVVHIVNMELIDMYSIDRVKTQFPEVERIKPPSTVLTS